MSAARAAFCEIEVGLEVLWLWILLMAWMISFFPAAKPILHPVIE